MNRFLTPLTNAIIDRKGTIDKYMGDAIMAFWNAPLDDRDARVERLRGGARHARSRRAAQSRARGRGQEQLGRPSFRSNRRRHQHRNDAWSATWAPTCALTIRCWATASIWRRGLKGSASRTACRSSSDRRPRRSPENRFAILELDFIAVKGKKEPEVAYAIVGRDDLARVLEVPIVARAEHSDVVVLSQPRLDRGAGGRRRRPGRRSRQSIQDACIRFTLTESAPSRSLRRPTTGMGPTHLKPNRPALHWTVFHQLPMAMSAGSAM